MILQSCSSRNSEYCAIIDSHKQGDYYNRYLIDYVKRVFATKEVRAYIKPPNKFIQLPIKICDENHYLASFHIEGHKILIELRSKMVSLDTLPNIEYNRTFGDSLKFLSKIEGCYAYGGQVNEYIIKKISDITVMIDQQDVAVPDSAFLGLVNPNFCETFYNIKPISGYVSLDGEILFLYIFGKTMLKYDSNERRPSYSTYIAKLIFDKDKYIGRVVVPPVILNAYNWDSCNDFIGF